MPSGAGNSWWIGVLLAIGGNLIDATGWTLEKRSHINYQRDNPKKDNPVAYLCNCQWWQGFLLHAGGSIVSSVSLGLGDQVTFQIRTIPFALMLCTLDYRRYKCPVCP